MCLFLWVNLALTQRSISWSGKANKTPINPRQTLSYPHRYERLSELVDLIFPPLGQGGSIALVCPEYSDFAYWRPPLPAVDLEAFS